TGIVTAVGAVRSLTPLGEGHDMRLVIGTPWPDTDKIPIGASIACAGCCLTAVAVGPDWFAVDVSGETLSKTGLGGWTVGSRVNLIPHTWSATTLSDLRPGARVHIEIDMLARYVARAAEVP